MKGMIGTATALALLMVAAATSPAAPRSDDKDVPSIKEVMQKLHKGAKSPLAQLKAELKSDSPPWAAIQDQTKDFVILGASLAKNEPPRGEKEGFRTLANQYFEQAKAMDDAAKKEDREATRAAFGKLAGSCMACHKAHRPPPQ